MIKKCLFASRLGGSKIQEVNPRETSVIRGVTSLTDSPNKLSDRLRLIVLEDQDGNDTKRFPDKIVALIDKLLE